LKYQVFELFSMDSYWSIAVSTSWCHCQWLAARRQAEWPCGGFPHIIF